ncbi:hypothetical protein [Intestinibacillus massiliensis]|uniref:hypothetical protein n=1 Tax=Intestinibacillus massiliensis TaxID=1871029 RepID=UPI000B35F1C0|nr:hypothetical protein [Intestinibacillus massiliensis]
MITMKEWFVYVPDDDKTIAYEQDHGTRDLEIGVDVEPGWSFKLDVETGGAKNVIDLIRDNNMLSVSLTRSMLATDGLYRCQLRGINGEQVRHSNQFCLYVGDSINASEAFPDPLPTEFEQIEARVTNIKEQAEAIALHPPCIGDTGTWLVWSGDMYTDSGIPARGETPEIREGYWYIGGVNTGVPASGGASVEIITNIELEEILR